MMNANYFIKKFEAIPDELWCTGLYEKEGRCCATGHCGYAGKAGCAIPEEARAFWALFEKINTVPSAINDGDHPLYQQLTPKARILAALRDFKEAECEY